MVVDSDCDALAGVPAEHLLDALVFSSPGRAGRQVFVAGEPAPVVETRGPFLAAMRALWG